MINILLLVGVAYLIFKVHQLEMLIRGPRGRRTAVRTGPDGTKVIPILKENIEPGPFRPQKPESPRESDSPEEPK